METADPVNGVAVSDPAFWEPQDADCPICGSPRYTQLGRRGGEAHRARRGTVSNIVRCGKCHGLYCRPLLRPKGNPYAGFEADEYFHAHEHEKKIADGVSLATQAERLLGRKGRVLELGCGRGENLIAAARAGWRVSGVEMTAAFADRAEAAGVEIERATVEASQLLEGSSTFDAIYLAAILEHLYEPMDCLRKVRRALVPGGVVFIDVPNECSIRTRVGNAYMRLRGRNWATNLSPTFSPFHVVGFCAKSLRYAVETAGLEVVELEVVQWRDNLPRRGGVGGWIESAGAATIHRLTGVVGDGDGITCWARRPNA